jgi:drug/metabolite transporter (DMT)-like permease
VNNLIGALWMIMAMAFFALVDTCIKLATVSVPRAQVVVVMGAVGLLAFALAARARGLKPMPPEIFRGPSLLRAAGEAGATTCFVFSLSEVDLSLFTTIVQANPLIVVLGAALFLGEPVGWRRWAAILLGMVGVLIVLRPTGEGFNAFALLVFLGVLSQSIRDLATRRVAEGVHTLQLSCGSFLALIAAGFISSSASSRTRHPCAPRAWPGSISLAPRVFSCPRSMPWSRRCGWVRSASSRPFATAASSSGWAWAC